MKTYNFCQLCPRNCHADRTQTTGFCGESATLRVARASLHMWEEPPLSGEVGSGTVFFSGCNLGCIFCQNHRIAHEHRGKEITVERLAEIFLELQARGAANINLVTAVHFTPHVIKALDIAKKKGYKIVSQQIRINNIASLALHSSLRFETNSLIYTNSKGNQVAIYLKCLL